MVQLGVSPRGYVLTIVIPMVWFLGVNNRNCGDSGQEDLASASAAVIPSLVTRSE